ncbi:olfactory receptor 13C7-like [Oryx dammah]|uniref:olfactory receptor 13C7-like n=1 Tax=Oryx dammah TaxID=59534 RepID=UPI001A9B553A|nr:olfactory receptor 13C7-like [Oryx dammah]
MIAEGYLWANHQGLAFTEADVATSAVEYSNWWQETNLHLKRLISHLVVMSKAVYVPMAAGSWAAGSTSAMVQTSLAMQLPFCGDNVINHFTCEILAVLKLACADISINIISMVMANVIFLGIPVLFIFFSYVFIIATILKIPSAEGRKKAFSTCSAHLTVVVIFYGTILFMYGKPKSKDPLGTDKQDVADKLTSLFYGVVTPMLNPIVYSLRNKDVKAAVRNLVTQKRFTW